jgi:transposase
MSPNLLDSVQENVRSLSGGRGSGRRPIKTTEEKVRIVLSILRGEATQAEVAQRLQLSQTTISKWQKQFLEGAHEGLARVDHPRQDSTGTESELAAKVDELTTALGEAYVELRVWRKKGAL